MYVHGLRRRRPLHGRLWLYGYRPKSVAAGLGCGLGCFCVTTAPLKWQLCRYSNEAYKKKRFENNERIMKTENEATHVTQAALVKRKIHSTYLLLCRSVASELRAELDRRQHDEEAWYRQQQLLLDAEKARRNIIAEEEQKLSQHRTRFARSICEINRCLLWLNAGCMNECHLNTRSFCVTHYVILTVIGCTRFINWVDLFSSFYS